MAGLTEPLELRRHINCRPNHGIDMVPFLDAVLIIAFVALNASAFVLSPGTAVQLPVSQTMETARSAPTAVLTVDKNELFFFEGRKLSRLTLEEHLSTYVGATGGSEAPILLIKADATITSATLFELMDTARRAGFGEIHLAAELADTGSASVWDSGEGGSAP